MTPAQTWEGLAPRIVMIHNNCDLAIEPVYWTRGEQVGRWAWDVSCVQRKSIN